MRHSLLLLILVIQLYSRDPYSILGVSPSSSKSEIQKAYRKLAKKYHPDINKENGAEEKFKEIAGAYEELTKEKTSQRADTTQRQHTFTEFYFNGQHFRFSSGGGGAGSGDRMKSHKDSPYLTVKRFVQDVLPDSYVNVHLVKVTSRWCFLCMEYDRVWPDIIKHFKPYQFKFWDLPYDVSDVRQKVSVYEIPSFLIIVSNRVYHFTNTLTLRNLEEFILSKIKSHITVNKVNDRSIDSFVGDFADYKTKLIFVSVDFTLVHAITAYKYKSYYKYGHSSSNDEECQNIRRLIPSDQGILIFKETYPAISRKSVDLRVEGLFSMLEKEKSLILPKLSSATLFDEYCLARQDLNPCVIFVLSSKSEYNSLRLLIQSGNLQLKRHYQFSFLYRDSQYAFVDKLNPPNFNHNVVVLQRLSSKYAKVYWANPWDFKEQSKFYKLLKAVQFTDEKVELGEVFNENGVSMFGHAVEFLCYSIESILNQVHLISLHTWLTIIMLITLFFVPFLLNNEPEERRHEQEQYRRQTTEEAEFQAAPDVQLLELTATTVPTLLPDTRSVITLLVIGDLAKRKDEVPLPVRVVSAKLKTLSRSADYQVGYISHVKYEAWLLKMAKIAQSRLIQGSAMAINYKKKYFFFFTPINTSSNSSLVNLQDRVTLWFERLCEGSLPKFYFDHIEYQF